MGRFTEKFRRRAQSPPSNSSGATPKKSRFRRLADRIKGSSEDRFTPLPASESNGNINTPPEVCEAEVSMKCLRRRRINIARKYRAVLDKGILELRNRKRSDVGLSNDYRIDLSKVSVLADDTHVVLKFQIESLLLTPLDVPIMQWKNLLNHHRQYRQSVVSKENTNASSAASNISVTTTGTASTGQHTDDTTIAYLRMMTENLKDIHSMSIEVLDKANKTLDEAKILASEIRKMHHEMKGTKGDEHTKTAAERICKLRTTKSESEESEESGVRKDDISEDDVADLLKPMNTYNPDILFSLEDASTVLTISSKSKEAIENKKEKKLDAQTPPVASRTQLVSEVSLPIVPATPPNVATQTQNNTPSTNSPLPTPEKKSAEKIVEKPAPVVEKPVVKAAPPPVPVPHPPVPVPHPPVPVPHPPVPVPHPPAPAPHPPVPVPHPPVPGPHPPVPVPHPPAPVPHPPAPVPHPPAPVPHPPKPKRREMLPAPQCQSEGIGFRVMCQMITSKSGLPLSNYEPLGALQIICEELQFSHLLDSAALIKAPEDRVTMVTAFALSAYTNALGRNRKPFNPLLGETFDYEENGWKYHAEQVSHHPPISAAHADGRGWSWWNTFQVEMSVAKFSKTCELTSEYPLRLRLRTHYGTIEEYMWNKVRTKIENITSTPEERRVTHEGTMVVKCSNGYSAKLHFKKGKQPNDVHGEVLAQNERLCYKLVGEWDKRLFRQRLTGENELVFDSSSLTRFPNHYGFTKFSMGLNEPADGIPVTDSRRRPDMRWLESANTEKAAQAKEYLEKVQRSNMASKSISSLWFCQSDDQFSMKKMHLTNGRYWKSKEIGWKNIQGIPEIFTADQ